MEVAAKDLKEVGSHGTTSSLGATASAVHKVSSARRCVGDVTVPTIPQKIASTSQPSVMLVGKLDVSRLLKFVNTSKCEGREV